MDSRLKRDLQSHYDSSEETLLTGWQQFNAKENILLKMKIGSIMYSTEIESNDFEDQAILSLYCRTFDSNQREQINNVFEKIRHKIPAPQEIHFGYTIIMFEKNGDQEKLLLFRCIHPSTQNVFFIELNGRTYENWRDFERSNKLQDGCEYFAPSDGVYSANGQICAMKREKTYKYIKPTLIVAGLSLAIELSPPMVMNAYVTYNCVSTMIDKYKHNESISVSEYLTLFAICLTQLCSAAVYYKEEIFEFNVNGVYWGEIALTFSVFLVSCLDIYITYENFDNFCSKGLRIQDVSISDWFNLLFRVLLLYEQIQNAREISKLLSKRSFNPFIKGPVAKQRKIQNNEKFKSTRQTKMKKMMPERAENNRAKADDGLQKYVPDMIKPITEEILRRLGYRREKRGFLSNLFDGLLVIFGGWFTGWFGWLQNLF